jgi:hypothetical protein
MCPDAAKDRRRGFLRIGGDGKTAQNLKPASLQQGVRQSFEVCGKGRQRERIRRDLTDIAA